MNLFLAVMHHIMGSHCNERHWSNRHREGPAIAALQADDDSLDLDGGAASTLTGTRWQAHLQKKEVKRVHAIDWK